MAKSYYSKKLDRVISARHNIDKWEVDKAESEASSPIPPGYSGMHDFTQNQSTQYVQAKQEESTPQELTGSGILGRLALDDILLAALILILLSDENKNTELILVLAFLLITGFE